MLRPLTLIDLNPHGYPTTPEIEVNLKSLLTRVNALQQAYGKQFLVTSGLRDMAQQAALIAAGKSKASKSKHLMGQAVDILDVKGELKAWILKNIPDDLWFEDFKSTPNWVHMQIVPPKSNKRFFIP